MDKNWKQELRWTKQDLLRSGLIEESSFDRHVNKAKRVFESGDIRVGWDVNMGRVFVHPDDVTKVDEDLLVKMRNDALRETKPER